MMRAAKAKAGKTCSESEVCVRSEVVVEEKIVEVTRHRITLQLHIAEVSDVAVQALIEIELFTLVRQT